MKAFVQTGYGSSDVIELRELEIPAPKAGEVLIRVCAASLAAGDYLVMRGRPFPARFVSGFPNPKKDYIVGLDCAGVVSAVGSDVADFQIGDAVYGECHGSCAEYALADPKRIARKPDSLTFEQAAAVPTSACTALQALRDEAKVQPRQRVLVNGASGGVGTFAVQIAKSFGAQVTGVCSTRNVELVRSIGADHVIDYTTEDFTQEGRRYDVILDNVASHSLSRTRRALAPDGVHIPSSGHAGMGWIIAAALTAPFVHQQGKPFVASTNGSDLVVLAGLVDGDKVTPVIDQVYPFAKTPEAFRYVDRGHARGKVVIAVGAQNGA